MIEKWKKDPAFIAEYDALEDEFALLDELLKARKKADMTQDDVARAINTKAPAVARIESGGGSHKHSPSVETLRKYAKAVGCRLKINLGSSENCVLGMGRHSRAGFDNKKIS